MAKMNYSKYKSTDVARIPDGLADVIPTDEHVEVIPIDECGIIPELLKYEVNNNHSEFEQSHANAVSPEAGLLDCIKRAIIAIDTISRCIAAVSIEKQKTEQVKSMCKAKIVESKEQTSRVKTQEKEETKRLKISCENSLKLQKIELEKLNNKLDIKVMGMEQSHKENMKKIELFQQTINSIMETKKQVFIILQNSELDNELVELQLYHLHCADKELAEIAKQIVNMKGKN